MGQAERIAHRRELEAQASASQGSRGVPADWYVDPADPAAAERFCSATRTAGTNTLSARYWDADKTIVLFSTKAPAPASCDDLGPHKVLKTFAVPATNGQSVKRTRCELTAGSLAGMNAVVSDAANATVYIFSPGFLAKDAAMKKIAGE